MLKKIFGFYDKVQKEFISLAIEVNAPTLIRKYLPSIAPMYPIKDIDILEIGELTGINEFYIKPESDYILHEWNEYKFPENKADSLAPLGADPTEIEKAFVENTTDVKE